MSSSLGLLFAALLVCGLSSSEANRDGALDAALRRLKSGDDGRGRIDIEVERDVEISEDLHMRIGATSVGGFGLMDLVSMETSEEGLAKINLRFPQLRLTSNVQLLRPSMDSTTEGEAILRFLDVQLHLQGVVEEASLKEVEATLGLGSVTAAFDLESRDLDQSRRLQGELRQGKNEIVVLFQGIVQRKIIQLMGEVTEENSALSVSLPPALESSVQKANRFVDQILADNRKALEAAIATVKLPDEYFEFSKKILFVETHGFAKLTNGVLHNLHAISRKGDCVIFAANDVLNIVIDLGLDNVLGGYFIETKFGVFHATSDLKLKIETVQLVIKGLNSFRKISDQDQIEEHNLLDFDVGLNVKANLGHIDVDVNISAVIDWLVNFIAEKVVGMLKGRLQDMIKAPIKDAIKGIINGSLKF